MSRPYRIVIWGPGEVGGAVLRAAHADPRFDVVGVKVFSPHKNGQDAGDLVGIGPIGITATTSAEEILALEADCVVVTPVPSSILEGLDADVIALLESGKNVVTTAAYHNVAQPNWFNQAQSPTQRLRAVSRIRGAAQSRRAAAGMRVLRPLTAYPLLDKLTDPVLARSADQVLPARATPERLLQACRRGGTSLHGTGVHPTFMVERLVMKLTRALTRVDHIRFVEALDFSMAPDGMWGGLELFGFGRPLADIDDDWLLAKMGDFYYGDLTSNVGHALFGAHPDQIRVTTSLRALPARNDVTIGSTYIRKGTAAAMHMVHRGYLGDHHFFTNEECWFLGTENGYYGDDVRFTGYPHGGYSYEITGNPTTIYGHIGGPLPDDLKNNPVTTMSVRAVLDAVGPVCESEPGVVIDDARPAHKLLQTAQPIVRPTPSTRVHVSGANQLAEAVHVVLASEPHLDVVATIDDAGCVVVTETDAQIAVPDVLGLLAQGKDVVTPAPIPASDSLAAALETGGATLCASADFRTFLLDNITPTLAQGIPGITDITVAEPGTLDKALPFAGSRDPLSYAIEIAAQPASTQMQFEFGAAGSTDPLVHANARCLVDAIASVTSAQSGFLVVDPSPRYRLDDRLD
ncbi:MAG: hypothetical protein JWP74_4019 [Marmoricola sp.]|nr:hypothetical protein [Marmoricola sp.]